MRLCWFPPQRNDKGQITDSASLPAPYALSYGYE